MWQSDSPNNHKSVPIPENLLKNFNSFDILEPQRNGAHNSDVTKVDKLIDIDDSSQDSGFHDFESSLLNKKKDVTLIDVYENIFVTPQDIKVKSKKEESLNLPITSNVDFKGFFDDIESGKKIDWMKPSTSREKNSFKRDEDEDFVKPRVLVPPVLNKPVLHEPDLDPDDLIQEVLTQKNIVKKVYNYSKSHLNIHSSNDIKPGAVTIKDSSYIKVDVQPVKETRPILNNITKNFNEANKPEIKASENDTTIKRINNNFTVRVMKKDEKVYKKKRLVKPESQTSKFTKGPDFYEKSVVLPQIMARMFERQEYLEEKNNTKKRLLLDSGSKIQSQSLNIEKDLTHEMPVKIDAAEKKTNSAKLTEAILSSANHSSNTTKKVECGTNSSSCSKTTKETDYGKLSPTVLMADCNKERLEAWQRSQLFKNFVLKGKFEL